MTAIVGIRCTNGIIIGADSSATFASGGGWPTIEQPTDKKIAVIRGRLIVAGTGYVGHHQRFVARVQNLYDANSFSDKSKVAIAKLLASEGLQEFSETRNHRLEYSALVAYSANGEPVLCELPGGSMHPNVPGQTAFQPEIKEPDDQLWFVSTGSGQAITDPFLALFRSIFWKDGPPSMPGGLFTALWALHHACEVNPGGIKDPVRLAVLEGKKGQFHARLLTEDDIAEAYNLVSSASDHFAMFKGVLLGEAEGTEVPPPKP